ncbi:MAG: glycogen debranching enzyme N-terminal domain-containing protein [Lentisphaeria bacterium]|nr:glycogen debranching enzyme N-terminal domain-containing protein [Lentisphaeria bacterium]
MADIKQTPAPGTHLLLHCGDMLEFRIESAKPIRGKVYLRSNLGNAVANWKEIVERVEDEITPGFQDWANLPMQKIDDFNFTIRLMLTEEGHFEGKCFIYDPTVMREPEWTEGENVHINVEPAAYCCANGVYCAFVRQFGANKDKPVSKLPEGITQEYLNVLDDLRYSVIPPSGTFRDLIKELDHIFDGLRCRVLHLLPIHPGPTVYGRMGRYGSPYAALDFTGVNPELAEFDRSATPLDQFRELIDAVHRKGGRLFIDIAINHTGWAAKLHETHPEWLVRNPDGSIHSPGAWGVTWGDLTELDHTKLELWKYLAGVFRYWCLRGVDGFRCDAGYMIPEAAWEYIVAKIREEFPETIFLLEGLGGDPKVTNRLLNHANLNWAYSELFQNYTRQQIEGYLNYAWQQSAGDGLMIHYAETHDNPRLAATSNEYAKMRTALAALTSTNGAFGFTNGVEWFAKEKIDVHEATALNWGAKENQIAWIRRLNTILAELPCFHNGSVCNFIDSHSDNGLLFGRTDPLGGNAVLIAVNLNTGHSVEVSWNVYSAPFDSNTVCDLLSGKVLELVRVPGGKRSLRLPGGSVFCLTDDRELIRRIEAAEKRELSDPEKIILQEAKAEAARVIVRKNGSILAEDDVDLEREAKKLLDSPEDFLRGLYGKDEPLPVVLWRMPEDIRREVMVPPGYYLLIKSRVRFRAGLQFRSKVHIYCNSLPGRDGGYFLLIPPQDPPKEPESAMLHTAIFYPDKLERKQGHILYLPKDIDHLMTGLTRKDFHRAKFHFMHGNGRGGLLWQPVEPGELRSRYDAVLLANLNPDFPENRHIMLRRFRIWSIYHAKTQEFAADCMTDFHLKPDGTGVWNFAVPVGNGLFVDVSMQLTLLPETNAVQLTLQRHSAGGHERRLDDDLPLRILVRPDLEDRSFHNSTKASGGPERIWPGRIEAGLRNFTFKPADDRILSLTANKGRFVRSDEWKYMIWQENEAARGLDPYTDLYSPGYFELGLTGNETAAVMAQVTTTPDAHRQLPPSIQPEPLQFRASAPIETALRDSLAQFIVKRDRFKTVIAGYPWFLDWGRDTLIAARGLIAVPEFRQDAEQILLQFASYAENGTIPNMICGGNADNRDTSDAPLWLFTACRDLCRAERSFRLMEETLPNGKKLSQVLLELAEGIEAGTPNRIKADPDSQLVFSPAHFTWMDTNYPAGTPRQGYPVEIQALWLAALKFLGEIFPDERGKVWRDRAQTVAASIAKYYWLPDKTYLSDCLHCEPGVPPEKAERDDHLRPNQLYAVTLDAVSDDTIRRGILRACSLLLIPGGIRSLDDAEVRYELPVRGSRGELLNDPKHPYWGHYEGDEDTRRKPAYHNGTAWSWQFPAYCEAYYRVFGESGAATAKALLASMTLPMNAGCLCQITEIMDGDYPHTQRGCGAQAWGVSEFLRVWKLLHPAGR